MIFDWSAGAADLPYLCVIRDFVSKNTKWYAYYHDDTAYNSLNNAMSNEGIRQTNVTMYLITAFINFFTHSIKCSQLCPKLGRSCFSLMFHRFHQQQLVLPDIVFQITQTRFVVVNKRLRVFCIRKADNIAVLGFMKADKARKPCHLRNLDQGVVIILTVVYV